MKKMAILVLLVCLLSGCAGLGVPDATPATSLESFHFSIGGFGVYNDYSVDSLHQRLVYTLSELDYGDEAGTFEHQWDADTWDAFTRDVLACGVTEWDSNYTDPGVCDGTQWSLTMEGSLGSIHVSGSNAYPAQWKQFLDVLSTYFEVNVG